MLNHAIHVFTRVSPHPSPLFSLHLPHQNSHLCIGREEFNLLLPASCYSQAVSWTLRSMEPSDLKPMLLPLLVSFNYLFQVPPATPASHGCLSQQLLPFISYLTAGDFNNGVETLKSSENPS